MKDRIKNELKNIVFNEDGNEAIQMACLMPILLLVIAFIFDRFIVWEGTMYTAYAANEAIRTAAVQSDVDKAKSAALETLSERFESTGMGWCTATDVSGCVDWSNGASMSDSTDKFDSTESIRAAMSTTNGWCNGSYLNLYVRAHKASLMPSYSSLRSLLKSGGPVYHTHTYKVKARVESSTVCKK